jgi:hypothetical protein
VGLQVVFMTAGCDGVVPGDMFEADRPSGTSRDASAAYPDAAVVHTRERSATGMVIGVTRADLKAGTPVRLTRKMPS